MGVWGVVQRRKTKAISQDKWQPLTHVKHNYNYFNCACLTILSILLFINWWIFKFLFSAVLSCFFVCLIIPCSASDTGNFTLADAVFFCISINIIEHCTWMQFIIWKQSAPHGSCFQAVSGSIRARFHLVKCFPIAKSQALLNISLDAL